MRPRLQEVAPGVFHVEGPDTNWQLLVEAGEVTLVDTGWPRDFPLITASLAKIGLSGADVAAIVLTHAHRDHLGTAHRFQRTYRTPVYAHAGEAAHVRGEVVEEASKLALLGAVWRPGVIRFVSNVVARGGLAATRLDEIATFGDAVPLDVPGRPIPVATPGHTSGHCAFHLSHRGVLLAGDACATFDLLKRKPAVGLMPSIFDHDAVQAARSLRRLASIRARTVLPGHGPPFVGTPAQLVEQALGPPS